ncbi:hypothetical protein SAMN05216327_111166 [Dyadobacter sp. SG02]|nr:hypothetical protein SAMN05216327_111166 [Dyadobacter sp. SG02]
MHQKQGLVVSNVVRTKSGGNPDGAQTSETGTSFVVDFVS